MQVAKINKSFSEKSVNLIVALVASVVASPVTAQAAQIVPANRVATPAQVVTATQVVTTFGTASVTAQVTSVSSQTAPIVTSGRFQIDTFRVTSGVTS